MNLALARAHGRLTQIRLLTADIYFFEKSDDCFPSRALPETFREPSGTHVKQELPCTLPVRLPEPFREVPELQ